MTKTKPNNVLKHIEQIYEAGVQSVDPFDLIKKNVSIVDNHLVVQNDGEEKRFDLDKFDRIFVIGAGKATANMAKAIEEVLGDRIYKGLIAVKYKHTAQLRWITTIESGHPIPDANGIRAAQEISRLAEEADEKSLVISLMSGGGSALIPYPYTFSGEPSTVAITLEAKQQTTQALLNCGATINEINCIRKHLSLLKGGRLAGLIHPATSVNLILSDVVGDRLDCIASGPTSPDESTFVQMREILEKYSLLSEIPDSVLKVMELGLKGIIPETPNSQDKRFDKSHNVLIGTNFLSLKAAAAKAKTFGYQTEILSSQIIGEAKEVAKVFCGIAKDVKTHQLKGRSPVCLIAGGETTVTIKGNGKGGRNQEMALSFLAELANDPVAADNIYFLAASTDGNDGPTDAAGAFACRLIAERAQETNLSINDYLKNNDAYHFFDQIGYLLKTGPTNTNVCDIQILVVVPD